MKCLCRALQGTCDSGHVSSAMQSKQGEAASWEDMYSLETSAMGGHAFTATLLLLRL